MSLGNFIDSIKKAGFILEQESTGLKNQYGYGHMGLRLRDKLVQIIKNNYSLENYFEIDSSILTSTETLTHSGHLERFNDIFYRCKECGKLLRDDKYLERNKTCECGEKEFSEPFPLNLLFKTQVQSEKEENSRDVYLRPETAQGVFKNFSNIIKSLPISVKDSAEIGIYQIGKSFRNELTPRIPFLKMYEFTQVELELFFKNKKHLEMRMDEIIEERKNFYLERLNISPERIRIREHSKGELSHYSSRTVDIEYFHPYISEWIEIEGIADRGNYDLSNFYTVEEMRKLRFSDIPYCLEIAFGLDRLILMILGENLNIEKEEGYEDIIFMNLPEELRPYRVITNSEEIYKNLSLTGNILYTPKKKKSLENYADIISAEVLIFKNNILRKRNIETGAWEDFAF